jgi:signal transduction histidine kinase
MRGRSDLTLATLMPAATHRQDDCGVANDIISLPTEHAPAGAPLPGHATASPLRVLLVEPEPREAEHLRAALAAIQPPGAPLLVDLVCAGGLEQALAHLKAPVAGPANQEPLPTKAPCRQGPAFDAVLLDLSQPESGGLDTVAQLCERVPHLPVVVLHAGSEALAIEVLRAGAQGCLAKAKVDGPALVRALRFAIARAQAQVAREQHLRAQLARIQAEEERRTRDAFLASAAHDLKGPLTVLKGNAQLLHRQLRRAMPATAALGPLLERVQQIEATIDRMGAIIDELLDLARVQMGQPLELHLEPVDLVAVARTLVAAHQAATRQHQLRLVAEEVSLVGTWDRVRLERVVDNLLSNAIKYSPSGGTITIEVRREGEDGAAQAVLAVTDEGIGIPAADLPHIFDRFRRARNVVDRFRGTGIGLASVRQIVEEHGGSISVASREGAGSTFTVRLPLAPPERPSPDGTADAAPARGEI